MSGRPTSQLSILVLGSESEYQVRPLESMLKQIFQHPNIKWIVTPELPAPERTVGLDDRSQLTIMLHTPTTKSEFADEQFAIMKQALVDRKYDLITVPLLCFSSTTSKEEATHKSADALEDSWLNDLMSDIPPLSQDNPLSFLHDSEDDETSAVATATAQTRTPNFEDVINYLNKISEEKESILLPIKD